MLRKYGLFLIELSSLEKAGYNVKREVKGMVTMVLMGLFSVVAAMAFVAVIQESNL